MLSMKPNESDKTVIVSDCRMPDGIVVDVEAGRIYWTNIGVPPEQRVRRARRPQ